MGEDLFASMAVSASGLSAQRKRMETIAKNIANAETTRSSDGDVYRRKRVVMSGQDQPDVRPRETPTSRIPMVRTSPMHLGGSAPRRPEGSILPAVEAEEVVDEGSGYRLVYDPSHPDADEEGYVRMPDVNPVTEMVDMMSATRAYEANLAAMKAYQSIVTKSLEI